MRPLSLFSILILCLPALADVPDTDGDGLSDFHETHKHFTDPAEVDSDGDGTPDGDWGERREYAYTVRSVVRVLGVVDGDALCDDYQDARVVDERDGYVEIEVIHYPLNTVADAITANESWRRDTKRMREFLDPGPTANWDREMRRELLAALADDGIDVADLDDRAVVEEVSAWLLKRAEYHDGFTTFLSHFERGKAGVFPGLEEAAQRGIAEKGMSLEEQWERELFAKGMFENKTRGSCTSSAIYLNGGLRAVGIPTRIVLCIPVVDASDDDELELVRGLENHRVRRIIEAGVGGLGQSWASHTFNEVFVGGRWRRLNYQRLGQNILDPGAFGLMTHIRTVDDWGNAGMAATWGVRQGLRRYDDVFGGSNPYSTIELSDEFGEHSQVENPVVGPDEHQMLTIESAYWYHSPGRPKVVSMRLDDPKTAGHVIVRVRESLPGEGTRQYAAFWASVGKDFQLRADGRPSVYLRAARGYWVDEAQGVRDFYLRIDPAELPKMEPGVPYALVARNGDDVFEWVVADGVTLVRPEPGAEPEVDAHASMTIDGLTWSDDESLPESIREGYDPPCLLAHVVEWDGFAALKHFTGNADSRFYLEAEGRPSLGISCGTGGITNESGSIRWVVLHVGEADHDALLEGVAYRLRPRNENPLYEWKVTEGLAISRE